MRLKVNISLQLETLILLDQLAKMHDLTRSSYLVRLIIRDAKKNNIMPEIHSDQKQ